jgi:hypothetical protein
LPPVGRNPGAPRDARGTMSTAAVSAQSRSVIERPRMSSATHPVSARRRGERIGMRSRRIKLLVVALALGAGLFTVIASGDRRPTAPFRPVIPKTWDDLEVAASAVPLADPAASPENVSADYYYRVPVRPIYRSYPVYAPGKEPQGYQEWLAQQSPETVADPSALATKEDWIRFGETVFNAPVSYDVFMRAAHARDPRSYEKTGIPVASDGTVPYARYVVREKGKVELGLFSCAMCHTRVMPDGTTIKGAQGNFPFDRAIATSASETVTPESIRAIERSLFGAPWVKPDPQASLDRTPLDTIVAWHAAIPPGVIARHGSTPFSPLQVPDLIGIEGRKYLDHTGLLIHRSIGDMMRYVALNQGADLLASYGGFVPAARDFRSRPEAKTRSRYSDEQLYALSLFLYALEPPPNPNAFDALAARGKKVFEREGCVACHTPPLYTNNKLTPVDGFDVPDDHRRKYDVMSVSVGTDPIAALTTRRGTGYYKVPSLKGVWYRGPFEHNGSVATLEDWFDPRRLRDDYAPTGFRGAGVATRPVRGHLYGLHLPAEERAALIAFLKTL